MADRREGVSVYYRLTRDGADPKLTAMWLVLKDNLSDGLIGSDLERLAEVLAQRTPGRNWPDAVAGDMERHYSPGRTWEATARALVRLIEPGRILDVASGDGVMGELLGGQAEAMECIDISPRVVSAGRRRLASNEQVRFRQADMHALPYAEASFDTVLMLHALTYSHKPDVAIAEAARVLAPGGRLLCATLKRHRHERQVQSFGHVNCGFGEKRLEQLCSQAGLTVTFCKVTSVESKPPHFNVITLLARKPQS